MSTSTSTHVNSSKLKLSWLPVQLVELKSGETYNGHLVNVDSWMNIHLREVICTSKVRCSSPLRSTEESPGSECLAWHTSRRIPQSVAKYPRNRSIVWFARSTAPVLPYVSCLDSCIHSAAEHDGLAAWRVTQQLAVVGSEQHWLVVTAVLKRLLWCLYVCLTIVSPKHLVSSCTYLCDLYGADFQDGDRFWRMPEIYIRGNNLKYIRIPEEVSHKRSALRVPGGLTELD